MKIGIATTWLVGKATTLGLLVMALAAPALADPPGWQLVWEDNFDTLDTSRWRVVNTNVPTNDSLQDYLPSQVSVSNGKLQILAENIPSRGLPYRSGQVITYAEQKYGRWEIHAKLPTTTGMWPAIWLLPDVTKHTWPSGGEIDIMENRGNTPTVTSSAFHYGTNPPFSHSFVYDEQQTRVSGQLVDYAAGYHTYAVDWTEDYLRFYVDDVHYYTVHNDEVGGFLSDNTQPMQLVINNAIGGTFLPNPDGSTVWPQTMGVDWVRVYEAAPTPEEIPFVNSSFDNNGGTLAGWSLFGNNALHDTPNVHPHNEAVTEGSTSLKIFGNFQEGANFSGATQGVSVAPGDQVTAAVEAFVRSQDSIAGTDNRVYLKVEFYTEFGAQYGSAQMISEHGIVIADGSVQEDVWLPHSVDVVAPAGAAEARMAIVFEQPSLANGAVHIDSTSFNVATPTAALGDFNGDGMINAADYTLWRDNYGTTGHRQAADANGDSLIDQQDYDVWASNYGTLQPATALPEPASGLVCCSALITMSATARSGR